MASKVTDGEFKKEVLESEMPVLVDFWAEYCGPCKMLAPTLDELSKDPIISKKIKILKMNVEENPTIPSALGIRGIPTMIIFNKGENVSTKVGALPKSSLIEWINSII